MSKPSAMGQSAWGASSSWNFQDQARCIKYSLELLARESITPKDAGCQLWLAQRLQALGFKCHFFSDQGVQNMVAEMGEGEHTIAFVGHTDVVLPGPLERWKTPPFEPALVGNTLIGRGAADMKTALAAMLAACEEVLLNSSLLNHKLMWLITSDEEGEAEYGSKSIARYLQQKGEHISHCIVGEPSATARTGDSIKVGRRGAVSGKITLQGKQGHVAYPKQTRNAINQAAEVINRLNHIEWDSGSDDFPGTSLQVTHIDSGDFVDNMVPGECHLHFNIRYSHCYRQVQLQRIITEAVADVCKTFQVSWDRPCEPYFTAAKDEHCLISAVERAIHRNTGSFPVLSTAGGTSDGRFYASDKTQVVEVGVPNHSIHQANENVDVSDLITLQDIYVDLLQELLF